MATAVATIAAERAAANDRAVARRGLPRWFDLAVAASLLTLSVPIWPIIAVAWIVGWSRWRPRRRVGRAGVVFNRCAFDRGFWRDWPALMNVLRGEMAFVGPRAVALDESLALSPRTQTRFRVRPGLVSLHGLRQRANVDYMSEWSHDREYLATRSARGDLGLLIRAALLGGSGRGPVQTERTVTLLGIPVQNLSLDEAVQEILRLLDDGPPHQVSFINADCVNISARDAEYKRLLGESSLTLADGIGVRIAGRILGRPIRQNVNGTDLFPRLCAKLADSKRRVFLLGGKPGVPEKVREWIARTHPGVQVCGAQHGYFKPEEEPGVVRRIAFSGADVLLVALGAPRQEKWIARNLAACGAKVGIGVGGLFDFYSGNMPRAPQWMRELGLEWLYRLCQEPRRLWRRYVLGNGVFLARVGAARVTLIFSRRDTTAAR